MCPIWVGSVCTAIVLWARYTAFSIRFAITSGVPGTSVTLSRDSLLCILLSSTVTVSGINNMILKGPKVSGNNFAKSTFAMRTDSVIWGSCLSTKASFPGFNCGVYRTDQAKLRL